MEIKLSEEETIYLLELLKREMDETKTEIHHSDSYEFKKELKQRLNFIQDMINKISESHIATIM